MTPAARVQAAIDLLTEIESGAAAPDRVVGHYFRTRRYIGSKDRRAIGDRVYHVLRGRARLDWWWHHGLTNGTREEQGVTARQRVMASLALDEGAETTAERFDGSSYGPTPLSPEEQACVLELDRRGLDHAEQPGWVRGEAPRWLWSALEDSLGSSVAEELAALAQPAQLDLRVNSLKADRQAARDSLAADGLDAVPTPYSPLGLRVAGRHVLPNTRAFREGLVEVQDEGSQVAALLCDARPGMAVADLCAGAGGKTLALGAAMEGRGRLVALDRDAARLARARPRLRRAGLDHVACKALGGDDDPWLAERVGQFDRVLLDAPCSGSGAWRRDPDARWRLTPTDLKRYCDAQSRLLELAAALVREDGTLIYATCSLLKMENQDRIADFLDRRRDFSPVDLAALWQEVGLDGTCPATAHELQLTPARQGTDGFYIAVLQRPAQRPAGA